MNTKESPHGTVGAVDRTRSITSYNRDQVKAAAHGHWTTVLSALGVSSSFLVDKHGPCPVCNGKDRFRFDDKNGDGGYFCNSCGAGDGFRLLMLTQRWSFPVALQAVANILGVTPGSTNSIAACYNSKPKISIFRRAITAMPEADQKAVSYNNWLWSDSRPIERGTPAYEYFKRRCNGWYADMACESASLRCHPGLNYKDGDQDFGKLPVIIGKVQNLEGELITLRRIYLTPDGRKAPGNCKRLTPGLFAGASKGAALRLFEPESGCPLIVGEGIETTLAAVHLWGTPGWAAGDAGQMESILLPPPDMVREVLIAVDHDLNERGEIAARKLEQRLISEGRRVRLIIPENVGLDLDDVSFN